MEHKPYIPTYQTPATSGSQRNFLPGPGEALPLQSVSLHFEGVIFVDGNLLRYAECLSAVNCNSGPRLLVYPPARITFFSPPEPLVLYNGYLGQNLEKIPQRIPTIIMTLGPSMNMISPGWRTVTVGG